ncbi:MAG TPA: NAD(P)/FAD-dependent oxidoreductase, partial [Tissierellaceae bacterium]
MPLVVKEDYIREIQGLSLKLVGIKVLSEGKTIYEDIGEILFTHYGVSGPLILSSSFFVSEEI